MSVRSTVLSFGIIVQPGSAPGYSEVFPGDSNRTWVAKQLFVRPQGGQAVGVRLGFALPGVWYHEWAIPAGGSLHVPVLHVPACDNGFGIHLGLSLNVANVRYLLTGFSYAGRPPELPG